MRAFSDDGQNPQRLLLPRDNPEHIDLWITDLFSGALPALAFGGETPGRGRIQSCRPCRENAARHVVHVPVKIDDLRTEYMRATLDESSVAADPLRQFERWFADAVNAQVPEPNAMTLATVGVDGDPSARIVLLKGADERGFTFFTNYASRKGRELAARPRAALLFFWPELERQIRVEGNAGQVDAAESAAYFAGRPRTSQLGAWASPQSEPIAARSVLEAQFAEFAERYRDESRPVPRPPHWGGYRLVPETIEFWQGRVSRLHDRIRYRRTQGEAPAWVVDRLAP